VIGVLTASGSSPFVLLFPLTFILSSNPHPLPSSFLFYSPVAGRISFSWRLNAIITMLSEPSSPITHPDTHPNHSYATRIRQNISIKPSARLRQSPDPPHSLRKSKLSITKSASSNPYAPHNYPQFPPPHIILHPEDANSKVFLAIGRSFLSVVRPTLLHIPFFSKRVA
jgi:hypothetical protein